MRSHVQRKHFRHKLNIKIVPLLRPTPLAQKKLENNYIIQPNYVS